MSGQQSRKQKGGDTSDGDETEEKSSYFIPSSKLDGEVLVLYVRRFLDQSATIHEHIQRTEPPKRGWLVYSRTPLIQEDLAAMMDDTTQWMQEKQCGRAPEDYVQSDTARQRINIGRAVSQPTGTTSTSQTHHSHQESKKGAGQYTQPAADSVRRTIPHSQVSESIRPANERGIAIPRVLQNPTLSANNSGISRQVPGTEQPLQSSTQQSQRPDGGGGGGGGGSGGGSGGGGGGQPSSTGTQGFSFYSTAGGPPSSRHYG